MINELAMANKKKKARCFMNLTEAEIGKEYIVKSIETDDEELNSFLFSLGCYSGEKITVVARRFGGYVVAIKDARYNIDKQLAQAIIV
jgi:ferrous iron transport protein A